MASILVVDDEALVAISIEETLKSAGHTVKAVFSASDIHQILETPGIIDLAVMDINLGNGEDGIELAKKLREIKDCEVLFLSAYSSKNYIARAQKVNAAGYLLKPFNNQEVEIAVTMALNRRKNAILKEEQLREEIKEKDQILSELAKKTNPLSDIGLYQSTEKIDLAALGRNIVSTHQLPAFEKRVQLVADIPSHELLVKIDILKLEKLLSTIVSKTIENTSPGGIINIIVTTIPNYAAFNISYNGKPIDTPEFIVLFNSCEKDPEIKIDPNNITVAMCGVDVLCYISETKGSVVALIPNA